MKISFKLVIQDSVNFIRNNMRSALALLLILAIVRIIFDHFSLPYLEQTIQLLKSNNIDPAKLSSLSQTQHIASLSQIQHNNIRFLFFIFIESIIVLTLTLSFIDHICRNTYLSFRQYIIRFFTLLLPLCLYFILTIFLSIVLLSIITLLLPVSPFLLIFVVFMLVLFFCLGPIVITVKGYSPIRALIESFKVTRQQITLLIPLIILGTLLNMLLKTFFILVLSKNLALSGFLIDFVGNFLHSILILFILISLYRSYMLCKQ